MSALRHLRVFGRAWGNENARRRTEKRERAEAEFLPAALELTETPPSPLGRIMLLTIVGASATAIAWACWAQVDEVAVAEGRLVPAGRLRTVDAAEPGRIRAILVREGDHVVKGQPLIELDPTVAEADAGTARTELATAALTRARDAALLSYAAGGSATVATPAGSDPAAATAERQLVAAKIQEHEAKLAEIAQRRAGADAAIRGGEAEISKLEQTIPLIQRTYEDQQMLERKGFGARQKLLERQQALISAQQDLRAQRARVDESRAQAFALDRQAAQARSSFIGHAAQERAEAESIVSTRGEAVRKADQRQRLQTLLAPVAGVVQELSVTTIGQTPEAGKPLITIVPDGEPLVIESLLLNRDAGFVRAGDPAVVKLETYPFTRFGTLSGVVETVSADAIVDEKRGLVFPVRVRLDRPIGRPGSRALRLTAGMSATVEVQTGRRSVASIVLRPLQKRVAESGRER